MIAVLDTTVLSVGESVSLTVKGGYVDLVAVMTWESSTWHQQIDCPQTQRGKSTNAEATSAKPEANKHGHVTLYVASVHGHLDSHESTSFVLGAT